MQPEAQAALRRVWLKRELARYRQRSIAQPDDIDNWRLIGRVSWELGDAETALSALDKILFSQPQDSESLLEKTAIYLALGKNAQALQIASELLVKFPAYIDALLYQIEALLRLGRAAEALEAQQRLAPLPLSMEQRLLSLQHQITGLLQLGHIEEALAAVENGLILVPNHPTLCLYKAQLFYQLQRFSEALEIADILTVSASNLQLQAQCIKARSLAALRDFDTADVLLNLLQNQYPHAVLEREFEPERLPDQTLPDSLHKRYTARGLYLMQVFNDLAECDWRKRAWVLEHIDEFIADTQRYGFVAGMEPHNLLQLPIAPSLQLAAAQAQAQAVDVLMAPTRERLALQWQTCTTQQRLRIGYVSGDFREHATAHLIRKLFQVHDREIFEVFAYSLRPGDNSHYWHDISQTCDQFIDLYGMSNADAAQRIANDGIQILIDLHGYTRFARPEIFALRPAPVQIAFLGYPGTLGAAYIPYMVADQIVLPDALRPYFSEQPLYVDCYQVSDDEEPIAATGMSRAALGLPDSGFVYCCFNTPYKIDPETFAVWMRILRKAPGSVLWLLAGTARCMERLRRAAQEHEVAPQRLVFAPRLPKAQHLERHRCADLFLDTFVINAHTSARDALWAGLPVLTKIGVNFQARVCSSLVATLGLPAAITEGADEYEEKALALAHDPSCLAEWRQHLAQQREWAQGSATQRFARQLEQRLLEVWQRV